MPNLRVAPWLLFLAALGCGGSGEPAPGGEDTDLPAAENLPEVKTGDALRPVARLSRKSALANLWLTRDGLSVYVLDLSDGRVLRVRASDLEVTGSLDVAGGVVAMTLDPSEATLYVAARDLSALGKDGHIRGLVHVIRVPTLELVRTEKIEFDPCSIAANDAGDIAVGTRGEGPGVFVLGAGWAQPARNVFASKDAVCLVRMHPGQGRLYATTGFTSPGGVHCVAFFREARGKGGPACRVSRHGNDPDLGGDLAISPDGHFLACGGGQILGLSSGKDADMEKSAMTERWLAATFVPGTSSFFTATTDGDLKQYAWPSFEARKSWKLPELCLELAIDPRTARVFALTDPSPDALSGAGTWRRRLTDVRSWSLEAK